MHYQTIATEVNHPEQGKLQSYGIKATSPDGTERTVVDVCTSKEAIDSLVDLCNREQLALCHLDDVIEDFLS